MTLLQLNTIVVSKALDYLKSLPDGCANTCVTSPAYFGLRNYGVEGQAGAEETPQEYVANMVIVFREVKRVLRDDGTLWLNLGDSYAQDTKWGGSTGGKHAKGLHGNSGIGRNRHKTGLPGKNLIGIPWRVAFALQDDGWILRTDIIWEKPNAMPDPVKDRPTRSHEYIFLFSKSPTYFYDLDAIKEPAVDGDIRSPKGSLGTLSKNSGRRKQDELGKRTYTGFNGRWDARTQRTETRNKRTVWTVTTKPFRGSHFATFPPDLIEPMILAGCPKNGVVLDPFMGSGTTALVARNLGRNYIGCDLNPEYVKIAQRRLRLPFEKREAIETVVNDLPLWSGVCE